MRWALFVAVAGCGFAPSAAPRDSIAVVDTNLIAHDGSAGSDATVARDYDGDGIPDDLDFCPHIANPANPDTDGDGVGDECDPRPGLADKRLYWSSFDDPLEINSWVGVGGWSVQSGEAVQGNSNNATAYLRVPLSVNRPYVATAMKPGTLNNGMMATPALGIRITTAANQYGCAVFRGAMNNIYAAAVTNMTPSPPSQWATNSISGTTITVTMNTGASTNACHFGGASTLDATTFFAGGETAPPVSAVEMTTLDATGTFEYLFIVDTSPT